MESRPYTIESFYHFIEEGKLMAAKCSQCDTLLLPPRSVCANCLSGDFEWIELEREGKLLTYTVIHVAPPQFHSITPYAVGIIKLHDGPSIPGMIKDIRPEKIKIGMSLRVDFDRSVPSEWPKWPRYFFKPSELRLG